MPIKNRKFNVAGHSFHKAKFSLGSLVYFKPEPNNPDDQFAVQVVNKENEVLGYVPQSKSQEINSFKDGKYKYYCASVIEIWDGNELGIDVPKIYARFSSSPDELPAEPQEWR